MTQLCRGNANLDGEIHEQVTLVPLAWISLYRFPMHVSLPFFIEKQLNVLQ